MPIKLTFASVLSITKGMMFIAFLVFVKLFRRNGTDVRYLIIETILVKITLVFISERVVANQSIRV